MHKFVLKIDQNYDEISQYLNFVKIINKKPITFETNVKNIENKLLWLSNKVKTDFYIQIIELPLTENIPYVTNCESIWFNLKDIKKGKITKLLTLIYKEDVEKGKKQKSETLEEFDAKIFNKDNADLLLRQTNQIVNTNLRGQVILGPGISKLIRHLELLFIQFSILYTRGPKQNINNSPLSSSPYFFIF